MATKKTSTKKPATKTKKSVADAPKTTALTKKAKPVTLVTGGTGFLGSHLVRLLVEEGAGPLRVLSTSAPAWLEELGVETVVGSITSPEDVARAVEGVAEVYHLAGRVSREREDAHLMYKLHVDGTRLLCEAAREAGVKSLVMASTSGTVAVTETGDVVPDEDWPTPLRHRLALALLREQGLSGARGAGELRGQRAAARDHEPLSAARPGRRAAQLDQGRARLPRAQDSHGAEGWLELRRRAGRGRGLPRGDGAGRERRALPARLG